MTRKTKDEVILEKINSGEWVVDCENGKVYDKNGKELRLSKYVKFKARYNGKIYDFALHRVMFIAANDRLILPNMQIDHVNRNGLDNRIENLREVTSAINNQNRSNSHLTQDDVGVIRCSNESTSLLAQKYGVSNSQINRIKRNLQWNNEFKNNGNYSENDKVILEKIRSGEMIVDIENVKVFNKRGVEYRLQPIIHVVARADNKKYNIQLHRVIFVAYHNRPLGKGKEIDHINKCPEDNRIVNLREVDRQINSQNRSDVCLTAEQVLDIYNDTRSNSEIAKEYGVIPQSVSAIKLGKTWNNVTNAKENPHRKRINNYGKSKLSEAQVMKIFNDPRIHREIAKEFCVSRQTVGDIKSGKIWSSVTHKEYVKGSNIRKSILTNAQILSIFSDERIHREIANEYGISRQMVGRIKNGNAWNNVTHCKN